MSGLLVKSTVVMRENLEEINSAAVASGSRSCSAAPRSPVPSSSRTSRGLRRHGQLRPRRVRGPAPHGRGHGDQARRAGRGAARAARPSREVRPASAAPRRRPPRPAPARSDVASDNSVPEPPFWGTRVVRGIQLADYVCYLDERATFLGQWGLKPARGGRGRPYDELVETEGRPRLRGGSIASTPTASSRRRSSTATSRASDGDDLVILHHEGGRRERAGSPSHGSVATGTSACRTSSGRRSPGRSTSSPSTS